MKREDDMFYLRKITIDDIPLILDMRNSDNVRNNFIVREPFTEESQRKWFAESIETGKAVQYIIIISEVDRAVGSVYIRDIDYNHRKGEFGIFIGDVSSRGKGLGTMVTVEMLRIAFEELRLHKVYLRVFADNIAAIKSYEKAGFEKEGLLKDDVLIDGSFRDMILMAKISNQSR